MSYDVSGLMMRSITVRDDGGDGEGIASVGRKIGLAETGEVGDENAICWDQGRDGADPVPPGTGAAVEQDDDRGGAA